MQRGNPLLAELGLDSQILTEKANIA